MYTKSYVLASLSYDVTVVVNKVSWVSAGELLLLSGCFLMSCGAAECFPRKPLVRKVTTVGREGLKWKVLCVFQFSLKNQNLTLENKKAIVRSNKLFLILWLEDIAMCGSNRVSAIMTCFIIGLPWTGFVSLVLLLLCVPEVDYVPRPASCMVTFRWRSYSKYLLWLPWPLYFGAEERLELFCLAFFIAWLSLCFPWELPLPQPSPGRLRRALGRSSGRRGWDAPRVAGGQLQVLLS